jgi:hypothetical protein
VNSHAFRQTAHLGFAIETKGRLLKYLSFGSLAIFFAKTPVAFRPSITRDLALFGD